MEKKIEFTPRVITAATGAKEPEYVRRELFNLNNAFAGIIGLDSEQLFYLSPKNLHEINAMANLPGNAESDEKRAREARISEIGTFCRLLVNMASACAKQKRDGVPSDEIQLLPSCHDGRFDCV